MFTLDPATKLLLSTVVLLLLLKAVALTRHRGRLPVPGLLLYLVWPGVDPAPFRCRRAGLVIDHARLFRGARFAGLGLVAVILTALAQEPTGLAGLASLLCLLHFGLGEILPWLARWAGWPANPLFDRPYAAASLGDFWSRRWNLGFVGMNHLFFARPLTRRLGPAGALLAIFAISGLFHEVAISWPAGSTPGPPFLYFALHGLLVLAERRWAIQGRAWTNFWLLAPLPYLFPMEFRAAFILPLFDALHDLLVARPLGWYVDWALWLAGTSHFIVLIATVQVPTRLGWREDLPKLTSMNRKLFHVATGYLAACIAGFGAMTLLLHREMMRGEYAGLLLCGFFGLFWLARLVIDLLYYRHDDWPPGAELALGQCS